MEVMGGPIAYLIVISARYTYREIVRPRWFLGEAYLVLVELNRHVD